MAEIGEPTGEPFEAPAPWEWPEPKKEEAPQTAPPVTTPAEPEKVPAGLVS